jgi:glycosyltransferase involved in cell wall biosynthesis
MDNRHTEHRGPPAYPNPGTDATLAPPQAARLRHTISIIIPVHNGGTAFQRCLASVLATSPQPYELIVVADGDTDGSRECAHAVGALVISNNRPQGPARARNQGAQHASGELLFFVDADVTLPVNALQQIDTAFTAQPDLSALIGSYDTQPAALNFLSQYRNLLHHYVHQSGRSDASTFWGACGVIRRDVFMQLGGFDQTYRQPSIEDIELGYRIVAAGHRIKLHKQLQVTHHKRWTAASILRTDFLQRALPWSDLILRDQRMANDLNIDHRSRVSVGALYTLLLTIPMVSRRRGARWLAMLCVGILLALNAPLYRFFAHQRGLWFALCTVPWHWLYYGYSGCAFGLVLARHWLKRLDSSGGHR